MTRTLEQLEKLAGIQIDEAAPASKEMTDIKKKVFELNKKNKMMDITKILKDLAKKDEKSFDDVLKFLVGLK